MSEYKRFVLIPHLGPRVLAFDERSPARAALLFGSTMDEGAGLLVEVAQHAYRVPVW